MLQQTRVMKFKYCAKQSEWLLNGEKLSRSNVFFITFHKKSVFFPVSFPEWKMVMCEHNYLGYVYFHQFQLHFHVYILFEIFQMCCINIMGQTIARPRKNAAKLTIPQLDIGLLHLILLKLISWRWFSIFSKKKKEMRYERFWISVLILLIKRFYK